MSNSGNLICRKLSDSEFSSVPSSFCWRQYTGTAEDKQGEINALLTELRRTGSINARQLADFAAKMAASPQLVTPSNQANYHVLAQWHHDLDHNWPELTHHFQAGLELARRYRQRGGPAQIVTLAFRPELLFNDKGLAAAEQPP